MRTKFLNITFRFTYLLWLKFRTSKDLDRSSPSGTSFRLLWLKSKVVNSSKLNNSEGIPEFLTLLCRKFKVRKQANSVNSPNSRSSLFFVNDRCSNFIKLPISFGISVKFVLSSFNHWTPVISRTAEGKFSF